MNSLLYEQNLLLAWYLVFKLAILFRTVVISTILKKRVRALQTEMPSPSTHYIEPTGIAAC